MLLDFIKRDVEMINSRPFSEQSLIPILVLEDAALEVLEDLLPLLLAPQSLSHKPHHLLQHQLLLADAIVVVLQPQLLFRMVVPQKVELPLPERLKSQ